MTELLLPGEVVRHRDLAARVGRGRVGAALTAGMLTQPWRGVVMRADDALDLRSRAAAAVVAVGEPVVLSGATAVRLHGYDAAERGPLHVTVPYTRSLRTRPGMVVHRNRYAPSDVVTLDGLPVLAHDLALADYLCDGDKWAAFASFDQALKLCGSSAEALRAAVRDRLDRRDDPRGIHRAEMLTDLATGKADSPPESIFRLIVVEAGLPIPEPQFEVRSIDGRQLYVLDMAWEAARVALEYDGFAAHEERAEYDATRDERLRLRGWVVVRATAVDLKDPSRVLAELRAALGRRR